jgi:predicted TIM-barrel fold metal-dependent hydrolase
LFTAVDGAAVEEPVLLTDYRPDPRLIVHRTQVTGPRYPVIDAHNHLSPEFGGDWEHRPVAELLDALDAAQVRVFVDLDGMFGDDILERHLDRFKAAAPERFAMFAGVNWARWPAHGDRFGEWAADELRRQVARGAQGLKVWKNFGLHVRDQHDALVEVDDPRLDPLWSTAGELNLPVTVHVADPVAFFEPVDATNERWEELHAHADWQFPSPPFPSFRGIVDGFARVVVSHPGTTFVGAHVGWYAENLAWVADLLERCPNFNVDIAARINELGRQPYSARNFFLRFSDRILFGMDWPASLDWYRLHYRFLQTADENFSYDLVEPPRQGRWRVSGLCLPDEVLERVYWRNAARLMHLESR